MELEELKAAVAAADGSAAWSRLLLYVHTPKPPILTQLALVGQELALRQFREQYV